MNYIKYIFLAIFTFCFFGLMHANNTLATSIPALVLTNNTSSVSIGITGADHNATVLFYYPNISVSNSSSISYTSIDIGQTDTNGAFNVSVSPSSYGLSGGISVYVSVNGSNSSTMLWPTSSTVSNQSGNLSLSPQNITLVTGQNSNIYAINTTNTLLVQGNSNPLVASAFVQSSNNSVLVTGLNVGSTTLSICAPTSGCNTVLVSIVAPTQTITFSQSPIYVTLGQSIQIVSIYGPGSGYVVANTNRDIVTASLDGTNLMIQGLAVGQSTVSVCASGWICGYLTVNSVAQGTAIPNQITTPPPTNFNFTKKPQLSSLSISSNNVSGLFFGAGSTITMIFSLNQTVNNVQVKVAGQQLIVSQGSDGTYSIAYRATGNETLPLPVVITYTNPSGLVGQMYFWLGNTSTVPVAVTTVTTNNSASAEQTFTKLLSIGSTGSEVKALQQRLKNDGLFTGSVTGTYGSQTEAAVKKYQLKHNLSQAGVVGPATRALLNKGI